MRIGRKGAGAASEHHAPASQMIEQGEPIGDVEWMMIRDADHPGTKHDATRASGCDRYEDFR